VWHDCGFTKIPLHTNRLHNKDTTLQYFPYKNSYIQTLEYANTITILGVHSIHKCVEATFTRDVRPCLNQRVTWPCFSTLSPGCCFTHKRFPDSLRQAALGISHSSDELMLSLDLARSLL
jgi:hypothetical protein